MRIIVFAHRLEVGGTQTNAIEIAAGLRDFHGFDVTLFATPGPMVRLAERKGLRFAAAPDAYVHPSLARMRALADLVRQEKPDLVHAWDWWQVIDALYLVHIGMRVPLVVSDMMMDLTRILPRHLPTTFGTPELVEQARRRGRTRVELLVPPVDVDLNALGAVDSSGFRGRFDVRSDELTLVTVSRLASHLKSESLRRSIDAVMRLGRDIPLRLIIVGDGAVRGELERLADETNATLRRSAVTFTGALLDPRPAYAAADIVIGMGGSSLRGLSFGKPVIVVGEKGFARVFDESTAESFFHHGMYGLGRGDADAEQLLGCIQQLAARTDTLPHLGEFGRRFVVERFSLHSMCERFAALCLAAVEQPTPYHRSLADGLRTAAIYVRERRFLTPSRARQPRDEVQEVSTSSV